MRLSDGEIIEAIQCGLIVITPTPDDSRVAGAAVDLSLGGKFRLFEGCHRVPAIDLSGDRAEIARQLDAVMGPATELNRLVLHPGQLALGITVESVTIPGDMVGTLNGRSSLARLGLSVHVTAHEIDPGWSGCITLEFFNSGPVPLVLHPGMRICALGFTWLGSPAVRPYNTRPVAKYLGATEPGSSRIGADQ